MVNLFADDWDREQSQPGFRWKRMLVGRRLGGELLGASVYELPPGQRTFPYHLHHANEELLVVLEGTPSSAGNDSGEAARVLIVSTMIDPEVAEYPDSGKIGFVSGPAGDRTLEAFFLADSRVDYFEGEGEAP